MGYTKNRNFYRVPIESPIFCTRRSVMMILNLSESLEACHGKTEHDIFVKLGVYVYSP